MIDSLLKDKVAKKIFSREEEGMKYAAEIISEVLELDYKYVKENLVMIHPEVGVNKNIINSEVDLVYKLDKDYVNIEINYVYGSRQRIKNNAYLCQLYLRDIKNSEDYVKRIGGRLIQINIDRYDYLGKNEFIYKFTMRDVKYNIEEKDFVVIYHINLAKIASISYNEIKEDRLKKILYMFVCEDKEELEKLYEGDEIMAQIFKVSKELEEHFDEFLYYDKEELERLDREDAVMEGRKLGKEEGLAEGLKEGLKEGIKVKALEVAKNMLLKNISIEDISEITGLIKEEIEQLK